MRSGELGCSVSTYKWVKCPGSTDFLGAVKVKYLKIADVPKSRRRKKPHWLVYGSVERLVRFDSKSA